MNPPPQCNSCGKVMVEVGGIGKQVITCDLEGKNIESREVTLYQCPSCKDIKLV